MAWVYAIPAWLFATLAVVTSTLLASAGLIVARRVLRGHQIERNDIAGTTVSTLGAILAVVLSFVTVAVWQEYDQAAATVQTEVNSLCDLYRDAAFLPEPVQSQLEWSIVQYVNEVVQREWPLMRVGSLSHQATSDATAVLVRVVRFQPKNATEQALQSDMIGLAHGFSDARRARLFDNAQAIPNVMWGMMFFLSTVTVTSAYLFSVTSLPTHIVVTASLAAVIAMILVLTAEFDLPFRGDIQIPPTAFGTAYSVIAGHPPNSRYLPTGLR